MRCMPIIRRPRLHKKTILNSFPLHPQIAAKLVHLLYEKSRRKGKHSAAHPAKANNAHFTGGV